MRVPLWTRLKNGQSVEAITAEGQSPQATWLDIVVTGRAKTAIRKSLKEEDRERFIKLGRELARVAFENVGKRATEKALRTAAKALAIDGVDDLLSSLGSANLTGREVVGAIYPDLMQREGEEISEARAVIGLSPNTSHKRARCCQPVPGERIMGITYRGQGVVVHAIDCDALVDYEDQPERWVDLHWQEGIHAPIYAVTLDMTITNDAGVLGRICTLIGEQKANISDLKFIERKPDYYRLMMDIDVRDAEHFHRVQTALEAESNVSSISRHRDPGLASASRVVT